MNQGKFSLVVCVGWNLRLVTNGTVSNKLLAYYILDKLDIYYLLQKTTVKKKTVKFILTTL